MKSWRSSSPLESNLYPVRLVRDTRVKAFTYTEAIQYLKEHNHLYRNFTWEAWLAIKESPEDDLLQAVDDYFMPAAYAELENKNSS